MVVVELISGGYRETSAELLGDALIGMLEGREDTRSGDSIRRHGNQ